MEWRKGTRREVGEGRKGDWGWGAGGGREVGERTCILLTIDLLSKLY